MTVATSTRRLFALAVIIATSAVLAAPAQARPSRNWAPEQPLDTRRANNTLYFELGGAGFLYSLNYERFLDDDLALRVGGMYLGVSASTVSSSASAKLFLFPITMSYLALRSGSSSLELGGGLDIVYLSAKVSDTAGPSAFGSAGGVGATGIIGYRYAPLDGGFNFRAAFTPMVGRGGIVPWFGFAFGAGF